MKFVGSALASRIWPVVGIGLIPCLLVSGAASPAKQGEPGADTSFEKWLKPMNWVRDREDPVLTIGEKGRFDDQHIFAPCVIRMGEDYWLYYAGSQNDVIAKGIYKPRTPLT